MPGVGGVSEKSNNGYYKVCGEQILHVDGNQSPLWMNDAGAKESNRFEREVKVFLLEPEVSGRNVGWESGAENTICVKSVIKPTALVLQEWLEKCRKVYANFQKSQKGTSSSAAATIPDRLSRRLEFNENAVPRVRQVKSVLELHQKNGPTAHLAR